PRRRADRTRSEDRAKPGDAYRWDAAQRKGLWVVHFGEMTESESEESDTGVARRVRTNIPGLTDITAPTYPGFVLGIPDSLRARIIADSVASWDRQGKFPDLVIAWLPRDHTSGRRGHPPTPRPTVRAT